MTKGIVEQVGESIVDQNGGLDRIKHIAKTIRSIVERSTDSLISDRYMRHTEVATTIRNPARVARTKKPRVKVIKGGLDVAIKNFIASHQFQIELVLRLEQTGNTKVVPTQIGRCNRRTVEQAVGDRQTSGTGKRFRYVDIRSSGELNHVVNELLPSDIVRTKIRKRRRYGGWGRISLVIGRVAWSYITNRRRWNSVSMTTSRSASSRRNRGRNRGRNRRRPTGRNSANRRKGAAESRDGRLVINKWNVWTNRDPRRYNSTRGSRSTARTTSRNTLEERSINGR
jgi:hypothetical protein